MIRCKRSLTAGIVAWLLVLQAWAGVADDISTPVFKDLHFSRDAIAVVLSHGAFKIKRKPGISEPVDPQTLAAEFVESNVINPENFRSPAPTGCAICAQLAAKSFGWWQC